MTPRQVAVRAAGAVVWVAALAIAANQTVVRMLTEPRGAHANSDGYLYLRSTSEFITRPTHLYDAAHEQVMSNWSAIAFVHPPSGLIPFLPFVPIVRGAGVPVAASVWTVLDAAAMLLAVVLAARHFRLGWLQTGAALLLITLTFPFVTEITHDQINGVVLLLGVVAMVRMPRLDAGVFMGLALAFKPIFPLILLVPLLQRQWKVTVIALATIAVANGVFVPFIGIDAAAFYVTRVLPFFAGHALHNGSNLAAPFVLQSWLGGGIPAHAPFSTPVPSAWDAVLLLWVLRLAVLFLIVRAAVSGGAAAPLPYALAMAAAPFFASTIWAHYLIVLYPLALAAIAAREVLIRVLGVASLAGMFWLGPQDQGLWLGVGLAWLAGGWLVLRRGTPEPLPPPRQRGAGALACAPS